METSKKTTVKRAKPQPPKVEPGEEQVLQFKLTLDGLRPKIWRRVQISSQATMFQFAHVIMELFHMENEHLYAFTFPETKGMLPKSDFPFASPCVRIELFADDDWNEPYPLRKGPPARRQDRRTGAPVCAQRRRLWHS